MNEQARRSSPPNRVRYPTDQQFASGCSPPCLGATQLPSATELWHTPTRTFTVLMWRPHGRTHSRESGNPAIRCPNSLRLYSSQQTKWDALHRRDERSEKAGLGTQKAIWL